MMRRIRKPLFTVIGVVVLFCLAASGYGSSTPPDWLDPERFRELPWGATFEQAQVVYQDLSFVRYAILDEKQTPSKVYERKNELLRIDGIRADRMLYWFRNNSFYKVTIHLDSRVGPRTITTPAAEAFEALSGQINGAMGEPAEIRIDQGISSTNKKTVWIRGEMSVNLVYLEPTGVNHDDLTLEIVTGPIGTGRRDPE